MLSLASIITILSVVVVVICGVTTNVIMKKNKRGKWRNAGEDVVVLHIFPRGHHVPNLSPFVIKLETYLRMANIPYVVDFDEPMGPKGKCPWITINGEDIGDSQIIIEMLGKKFGKDFSSHLTPVQKGIALAIRITMEEHFLWCLAIWRFGVDGARSFLGDMEAPKVFRFLMPIIKRNILKSARTQGLGAHSHQEIEAIGRKDLAALSAILGDNSFLMGEEPTEVDCSIFGFLCQVIWGSPPESPYFKVMESELPNLKPYCLRMKEKYWPDWNSCLNPKKGEETEA